MNEITKMTEDYKSYLRQISYLLDHLMYCKGREPMSSSAKEAWVIELDGYELDSIEKAVKKLIKDAGAWPEVGYLVKCMNRSGDPPRIQYTEGEILAQMREMPKERPDWMQEHWDTYRPIFEKHGIPRPVGVYVPREIPRKVEP